MPSAKILAEKQAIVADLTEKIKGSVAGVVVNYEGITVDADTALRKELREANVDYRVYKNSYTARACDNAGYSAIKEALTGMTAIAISKDDPIVAAKIMKKYAEKIDSFEMKIGYVDGEILDQARLTELADTPSKEVLLAKLMGSLQSSLYGLACALQAIVDKSGEAPAEEAAAEEAAPAEAAEEAPAAE